MLSYQETLEWMYAQLPMYQRQGKTAFKKDLTNIHAFCELTGHPEQRFKSIHVAGTNGKGSTSHMLAAILQTSGYKVGLYTSPHLKDFRERIKINGQEIPEEEVVDFRATYVDFLQQQKLSFFEMTVGMAFKYFADEQVDIAVIEVGLGGRLDSTNVIDPMVSVITNIGKDHTQFLGETYKDIAQEKAGIIKPNTPVVVGEYHTETYPVFQAIAGANNAQLIKAFENKQTFKTDLKGHYQKNNINTAVAAIQLLINQGLKINEGSIEKGLMQVVSLTGLKGRWQVLQTNPKVICDTAHNKEGLLQVMAQLSEEQSEQLHIVLGVVNDKTLSEILPLFTKEALYYFCKPDIPRGLAAEELRKEAEDFDLIGECYPSVVQAYNAALNKANNSDVIYCGGSTFVVAELPI